jgi:hypothetical protein
MHVLVFIFHAYAIMHIRLYARIEGDTRMATKRLNLVLNEDTEERFRRAVFEKYGMKKGNIQIAVEEALGEWIARQEKKEAAKR